MVVPLCQVIIFEKRERIRKKRAKTCFRLKPSRSKPVTVAYFWFSKYAFYFLQVFRYQRLKTRPTGLEPVTAGSEDGSKIRFSLSLSFFPIPLCGKYAGIFTEF